MSSVVLTAIIALAQALGSPIGVGSSRTAPAPATTVPEVTVTAPSERAEEKFIDEIGQTAGDGQLATWQDQLCPEVIGLNKTETSYYESRIVKLSRLVRDAPMYNHCSYNTYVYFTAHPYDFALILFKRSPSLFDYIPPQSSDYDAPVSWRYGLEVAPADGVGEAVSLRNGQPFLTVLHARDSRILLNAVYHINMSIIIVDTTKVRSIKNSSLSDYIATVALSQISSHVDVENAASILTLFIDRDAGRPLRPGVTSWDLAYLRSLYSTRSDVSANTQRLEMVDKFKSESEGPPAD